MLPTPEKTQLTAKQFTEHFNSYESHRHGVRQILVQKQTAFQKAVLADFHAFGRCLILDGEIQSAQIDEFIYHESLVQPAMTIHPKPKNVLILGGGEGATVREVLRHSSVEQVTMVDIDGEVVDFCKTYLTRWHQGTLAHPKTRLIIDDAYKFIFKTTETFDIIISDLPTPIDRGPVYQLYTLEFYQAVQQKLRPGGLVIVQAGSGSFLQLQYHAVLARTLQKVFQCVRPYYAFVPSFDVPWAFLMATRASTDPMRFSSKQIDRRLKRIEKQLRFYDGQTHVGLFQIPKYYRSMIQYEKRFFKGKTRSSI